MNYHTIKKNDIANGDGVRTSIFVSGCTHHCKGCFNPETWSFGSGQEFTQEQVDDIIKSLKSDYCTGLSLLGGEPFEEVNAEELYKLVVLTRKTFGRTKSVWAYSGYTYEQIMEMGNASTMLLKICDVLVDGEFIEKLKDPSLKFRGSSNQRLIDVQRSIMMGQVVEVEFVQYDEMINISMDNSRYAISNVILYPWTMDSRTNKIGLKEQLCWTCEKGCGQCSWSKDFKPVEGWDAAIAKYFTGQGIMETTYRIYDCPEYVRNKLVYDDIEELLD